MYAYHRRRNDQILCLIVLQMLIVILIHCALSKTKPKDVDIDKFFKHCFHVQSGFVKFKSQISKICVFKSWKV